MGEETATVRKPPNHALFNGTSDDQLGNMSSLLKKRLEAKKNLSSVVPNYTVNMPPITMPPITMPPIMFPQPLAPPAPAPAVLPSTDSEMLIPDTFTPGTKISIADFCNKFDLDEEVQSQLTNEGYCSTASFVYAKISDLSDAGFKRGEIFEIKVAISQWAVKNV